MRAHVAESPPPLWETPTEFLAAKHLENELADGSSLSLFSYVSHK